MNVYDFMALFSIFGFLVTLYLYGRKIGFNNLNHKHNIIIACLFFVPGIILPAVLQPYYTLGQKIGYFFLLMLFCAARYLATALGQRMVAKIRENKK